MNPWIVVLAVVSGPVSLVAIGAVQTLIDTVRARRAKSDHPTREGTTTP